MRGLAQATGGGRTSTTKAMLVGEGAIAAVLFGRAEKALCYSGAVFVPGTESSPSDVGVSKVRRREEEQRSGKNEKTAPSRTA